MSIPSTLVLTRKDISKLIDIKRSIKAVEAAFREHGLGKARMPAKMYLNLPEYSGDFRAMPAYLPGLKRCALKWVNAHPKNKSFGLPAVMAVLILSDPRTGFPLAVMDGTLTTNLRTGAAGAVAAKYLARKNSNVVGLVGCGAQAKAQLQALRTLFNIKGVRVWGHQKPLIDKFIKDMRISGEDMTPAANIRDCVRDCDIVVTTTPSRKPIVKAGWLKDGVHINAIGADAKGKQELDPDILKNAKIVIDDWTQASHSGEINVPLSRKLISRRNIYTELGRIVCGKKKGRTSSREWTVFDSTGLAIQDVAIGNLIYKTAKQRNTGKSLRLL
jgi:alanine dehydrogenase